MEQSGAMPSIAIAAIALNEADILAEWIAFHLRQGVARIHIRLDADTVDDSAALLDRIGSRDPTVTWAPWDPGDRNFDLEHRATCADAASMLAGQVTFLACIDIDEFLFPRHDTSLPAALAGVPREAGGIAIGHRIFGSGGRVERGDGLVIERFLRRAAPAHPEGCWFKSIVRPECVSAYDSSHSAGLDAGNYVSQDGEPLCRSGTHPGRADAPSMGPIALHHYVIRSAEEFAAKRRRWLTREVQARCAEGYFRYFDSLGNAVQNREALRFAAATRDLARRLTG